MGRNFGDNRIGAVIFGYLLLLRCARFRPALVYPVVSSRSFALSTVLAAALLLSALDSRAQNPAGSASADMDPYTPDSPGAAHAKLDLRVPGPNPDGWLFPVTELDTKLPSWLQFGGQFRNRVEGQIGFHYAPTDDLYDLTQLRVGIYIQPTNWFKVVAVTQDSRAFFNHHVPNTPSYQNIWDLREAYARIGNADSGWISATVGRQILSFGDERVIGPSDWVNMGRTFDTARVDLNANRLQLAVFAASVIIARDGVMDHHIPGNNLYGIYASLKNLIPHATLEPYLLWRVAPAGLRLPENGSGLGALSEITGGARLAGTAGPIDFDIEMNQQTGSLGPKTIDAWAGHWNAGYVIQKTTVKPRLFLEYNYASGNKHPNGSSWGTHDEIYPSAHNKMDFADQFGWRNIRDLRAGVQENLGRMWSLNQVVDNVWLATKYDAMYSSSGAVSVAAHPNVTSTHVGVELELIAECKQNKHITYGFGWAHLFPGAFLNQATPGRDYSYPFAYSTYIF
jgi:hypothetical protein